MSTSIKAFAPLDRHRTAVRNSFGWAQDSADRGDYADALGWIDVLEAIGEAIPTDIQAKRRIWDGQVVEQHRPGTVLINGSRFGYPKSDTGGAP